MEIIRYLFIPTPPDVYAQERCERDGGVSNTVNHQEKCSPALVREWHAAIAEQEEA